MTTTEKPLAPQMSTKPPKERAAPKPKKSPATLAMKHILKMPLGELTRLASELAEHRETAEFLNDKLAAALKAAAEGQS